MMHGDEEGTHAGLTALMDSVVYPAIAEYGGRVVKCTGDGFLAEFMSAIEAVRAASRECRILDFHRLAFLSSYSLSLTSAAIPSMTISLMA